MSGPRARAEERRHFDADTRLTLLEGDADEQERATEAFDAKLNKILWALVSLLIMVTTAAILLAVNLTVDGGQVGAWLP